MQKLETHSVNLASHHAEGHFFILMLSHNLGKTNSCKTVLLSVKSGLFNRDQNAMLTLLKTQTVYKNIKMTSAASADLLVILVGDPRPP